MDTISPHSGGISAFPQQQNDGRRYHAEQSEYSWVVVLSLPSAFPASLEDITLHGDCTAGCMVLTVSGFQKGMGSMSLVGTCLKRNEHQTKK